MIHVAGSCFLSCALILMLIPTANFAGARSGHDNVEKEVEVACEKMEACRNNADSSALFSVKEDLEL